MKYVWSACSYNKDTVFSSILHSTTVQQKLCRNIFEFNIFVSNLTTLPENVTRKTTTFSKSQVNYFQKRIVPNPCVTYPLHAVAYGYSRAFGTNKKYIVTPKEGLDCEYYFYRGRRYIDTTFLAEQSLSCAAGRREPPHGGRGPRPAVLWHGVGSDLGVGGPNAATTDSRFVQQWAHQGGTGGTGRAIRAQQ